MPPLRERRGSGVHAEGGARAPTRAKEMCCIQKATSKSTFRWWSSSWSDRLGDHRGPAAEGDGGDALALIGFVIALEHRIGRC